MSKIEPATDADLEYLAAAHDGMIVRPNIVLSLIARIREAEADELNALDLCSAAIEDYNTERDARIAAEKQRDDIHEDYRRIFANGEKMWTDLLASQALVASLQAEIARLSGKADK